MKILFLTAHDDIFLPNFYKKVFSTIRDEVVGLAIVKDPGFYRFLWKSLHMMGAGLFISEIIHQMSRKAITFKNSLFRRSEVNSLKMVCRQYEIPCFKVAKVNSREFRATISELNIDLMVSTACPQILGRKTLGIPSQGSINVHYGLLPDYKGMYPSFWVLANGETETGVSVHYMEPEIDSGDILVQIKESIRDNDSFFSLVERLKSTIGPIALLQAIDKIKAGGQKTIKNEAGKGSYYSFPQRKDMREFKRIGRKWR